MYKNVLDLLSKWEQISIINHIKELSEEKKREFIENLLSFDIELPFRLFKGSSAEKRRDEVPLSSPSVIQIPSKNEEIKMERSARALGERYLTENKIAILLVAGGHGSRLGFPGPKGLYPITPVKKKSLFQLFCEYILAISNKYKCSPLFLIMTSDDTHEQTINFFEEHSFFGLKERIVFFKQDSIPSISDNGELLLKDETHIVTNPDGHGGLLNALKKHELLNLLLKEGFEHLFYFQVDNPLVKIADPVFLGYHVLKNADFSTKVVRKRNLEEKVGIYVTTEKGDLIVEYSEKNKGLSTLNDKGEPVFWAGNTAIHVISLRFLKNLIEANVDLPYHRAERDVDVYDKKEGVKRKKVIKFEKFIFDLIPYAERTCVMEIKRDEEFSPIKNFSGQDSPDEARMAMCNLYRKYLREIGIHIPEDRIIEISPDLLIDTERLVLAARKIDPCSLTYLEAK